VCNIVDTYIERMIITQDNQEFYLQAMKVDFLDKAWEREWYTLALMRAAAWGREMEEKNNNFKKKNRLVDKYREKPIP
jgi:hypothetical protein